MRFRAIATAKKIPVIRKITNKDKEQILQQNLSFADSALRVLGFAYKKADTNIRKYTSENTECDLIFIGLVGMIGVLTWLSFTLHLLMQRISPEANWHPNSLYLNDLLKQFTLWKRQKKLATSHGYGFLKITFLPA